MPETAAAIHLGCWEITAAAVRAYLAATGDPLPIYQATGFVPPLLLSARVVGLLLDKLSLPDGAIHSQQELTTLAVARVGDRVSAYAHIEPAQERGGMRFLTVNYIVADPGNSRDLMRGRTTVLLPTNPTDPADPAD